MPVPTTSPKPFIPAPGVMQAEMIYNCLGQKVENVYHFLQGDGATPPSEAQMTAVAVALEAWEHGSAVAMRNTSTILTNIIVRDLTSESAGAIEHTPTTSVTGVQTSAALANNVTVAVKWTTRLHGRSFRGRSYHIGMYLTAVSGNQLTTVANGDFQSRYDALRTQLETIAGISFVVLSFAHNKFWRDTALATRIIQCSIDPNLDSQRRRLAGRGT